MSLRDFVRESNRIEGILREPTAREIQMHRGFLRLEKVRVEDLQAFVAAVQPGARLRDLRGLNVRVGNHVPPPGGPEIRKRLAALLDDIDRLSPYEAHVAYETLHPFTDGNGRSGRVLWLWQGGGHAPLGFLHQFYYQALDASRPSSARSSRRRGSA